ncbi:MAG TPA: hypothetical protein PKA27_13635 [Fimbriimonadaceae bacterium]|nr:hypothetical protein [Fimbriimonadaceae bacterium]
MPFVSVVFELERLSDMTTPLLNAGALTKPGGLFSLLVVSDFGAPPHFVLLGSMGYRLRLWRIS